MRSTPTGSDDTRANVDRVSLSTRQLYIPLYIASTYLFGTFALFLLIGPTDLVPNMSKLMTYVLSTIALFAIGYVIRMRSLPRSVLVRDTTVREVRSAKMLITLCAGYLAAYGISYLITYGATGPDAILTAMVSPGSAYAAKFHIYALQAATGERNLVNQILTIFAVLYAPLMPMSIVYWRHLMVSTKSFAAMGLGLYALFFLFIGTLKGLGDVLIFGSAAMLVLTFGTWYGPRPKRNTKGRVVIVIAFVAVTGYMATSQTQRMTEFGIAGRTQSNPFVASIIGDSLGRGLQSVMGYPTQGYLGLAYNLDTQFVWTRGLGSSRAVASYWDQYIGQSGTSDLTYPARTEARTGWPAGMYWATIYPWLASDLTFPGAAILMGVVGWLFAKFWYEAAFGRGRLALLLFCQIALFLAFVPANNQIGIGRQSMITLMSLVTIYLFAQPGRAAKQL